MPEPSQLESLITYIAKSLVDRPEKVELKLSNSDGGLTYELEVAPEDVGKVIGRDGRTVNAMRTLLSAAAQRRGEKARLEIIDDRKTVGQTPPSNGPPAGPQPGEQ